MRPPDLRTMRRLLIVKLSSMGDLVHALPVAAALRDSFPSLEVSWAAHPAFAPVVAHSPVLAEVIHIPRARNVAPGEVGPLVAAWRAVRRRRFDVVLDLHGLSKSALVVLASGARYRYGWDTLREVAPLISRRIPRRPGSHNVVEQLLDVAHFLGADTRHPRCPIATGPEEEREADAVLAAAGANPAGEWLVLNPTAGGGGSKGLEPTVLARALDQVAAAGASLPVVLVGGRLDQDRADAVQREVRVARVHSVVGHTSLGALMAVVRRGALHLGGDTGSSHLAAAFGVPTVSWFGRTDPARSAPYGNRGEVVEHRDQCVAACRARRTHINSPQRCVLREPACLPLVTSDEIAAATLRLLARPASPSSVTGASA